MSALVVAVPPGVSLDGTEESTLYPVSGVTVYFSVELDDGTWWNLCSAVTDSDGEAACAAPAPDVLILGVPEPVSAWSAVYQGSFFAYGGSSDYGLVPGAPTPQPTPPGNGGITITPQTYVTGCQPPDPSQQASLGDLLTDGGNCQLVQIEKIVTQVVFAASAAFGVGEAGAIEDCESLVAFLTKLPTLIRQAASALVENGEAQLATQLAKLPYILSGSLGSVAVGTVVGALPALAETGVIADPNNLTIAPTGAVSIGTGTTINYSGVITNDGVLTDADSSGQGAGTIDNTGTIVNDGSIPNDGQGDGGLLITGNNYTLNFDVNGGPGATPSAINVLAPTVADSEQSLPTPQVASGYTFLGWYTAPSGGTLVTSNTDLSVLLPTGPSSTTLYAQYAQTASLATATQTGPASVTYSGSAQDVTLSAQVVSNAGAVDEGTMTFNLVNGSDVAVGTATAGPVSEGTASVLYALPAGLPAGAYTVEADYSDPSGNFESSGGAQTLTVGAAPTTTVGDPTSFDYTGAAEDVPETAQVTSAAGAVDEGTVTFALQDASYQAVTATASVTNGTASAVLDVPAGLPSGTYTVLGSFSDTGGEFAASTDLAGGLIPQTITLPNEAPQVVGRSLNIPFPFSQSIENTGSWSVDPASTGCNYVGATVYFVAAGNCILDATFPAEDGYAAAISTLSIQVGPGLDEFDSTTTFPSSAAVGSTFAISATSTSGLPVSIAIDPSSTAVCSIWDDVVTFNTIGSCSVDFATANTPNYTGLSEESAPIDVVPQPQSIYFSTPPTSAAVGDGYQVSATSDSGAPVGFSIDPSSAGVCTLTLWTVTFDNIGSCQIDATAPSTDNYLMATSSQTVTVGPDAQGIYFSTPPANPVVGDTYPVSAASDSGAAVSLSIDPSATAVCSLSAGTVTFDNVGACQIDGSVPESGNYAAATSSQTVTVGPEAQGIYFSTVPTGAVVGQTYQVSATSDSGAAVSLSIDTSATGVCSLSAGTVTSGTVTFDGVGACQIDASVPASGNYAEASSSQTVNVGPSPKPKITTVSPDTGPLTGGTPIIIRGSGFVAQDQVVMAKGQSPGGGAISATQVTAVSPTEITAVTGTGVRAGSLNVFVVGPGKGPSRAVIGDRFTYQGPPKVAAVSPATGPLSGGTRIIIRGSGFVAQDQVVMARGESPRADAIAATPVKVVSPTEITAVTGAAARAGTYNVFVVGPGDEPSTAVTGDRFTYRP
jgi:Listeria-Bacteroides repeat domain (List_Bact_rpt)/IPT/TIG domain